jgi:recombination protein RecA
MAKKKKKEVKTGVGKDDSVEDISKILIKEINSEVGGKVMFTLDKDSAPSDLDEFIPTGSKLLDYAISNRRDGGIPAGRITEISGDSQSGKSLLAYSILKEAQKRGYIALLLDAENSVSKEYLKFLGLNLDTMILGSVQYIEQMFTILESVIKKNHLAKNGKRIVAVVDSIAALPPLAELEGSHEDQTIGLAARKLGQGLRKITQMVGSEKVTLILLNQLRIDIGCLEPETTYVEARKLSNVC